MKKLLIASGLFIAVIIAIHAAPVQLVGSLVTVNNTTNNSTSTSIPGHSLYLSSFSMANGGLTDTNACLVNIQVSMGSTNNFATIAAFRFTTTNATNGQSFSIPATNIPVYMRAQVITTNSVDIGINYGN